MKYYLAVVIALFGFAVFMELKPEQPKTVVATSQTCELDTYACKVYHLTNLHRESIGLNKLKNNPEAQEVAKARSKYLCESDTFSHDNWEQYLDLGHKRAGENLTKGYKTPEKALEALLNSPLHKDNIEGEWDSLGIYTEYCNGKNITTQIFIQE